MPLPQSIIAVCESLRGREWRDADEDMDADYVMGTEAGVLVRSFEGADGDESFRRLAWLAFFAARRALPCWDAHCDRDTPHQTIAAIERWLLTGIAPQDWKPYTKPSRPEFKGKRIIDCRASETECAAASVASAARFVSSRSAVDAICALSAAYMAFDESGKGEAYARWLLDVAVPAAYDCRELTDDERKALFD